MLKKCDLPICRTATSIAVAILFNLFTGVAPSNTKQIDSGITHKEIKLHNKFTCVAPSKTKYETTFEPYNPVTRLLDCSYTTQTSTANIRLPTKQSYCKTNYGTSIEPYSPVTPLFDCPCTTQAYPFIHINKASTLNIDRVVQFLSWTISIFWRAKFWLGKPKNSYCTPFCFDRLRALFLCSNVQYCAVHTVLHR